MALSLVGSFGNLTNSNNSAESAAERAGLLADAERLHLAAKIAFSQGRYQEARQSNLAAAEAALRAGSAHKAAMNWNNAGAASIAAMQYETALQDLIRARDLATASHEMAPLLYSLNNMASLYLQMGAPETALRIARDALAGPAGNADAAMHAKVLLQEGQALAELRRFDEGLPFYREGISRLLDTGDLDGAARGWSNLGSAYLDAERYPEAEWALSESLRLVRTHRLKAAAGVLVNLGRLRSRQGDHAAAEALFQNALDAHESVTPAWVIYFHRGYARLEADGTSGALADFREARRLALRMRAEVVPVDRTRVGVEGRVNRVLMGLIVAGNRVAGGRDNKELIAETFDAAEQDRLWSLRSLVPAANDWRRLVPARYWESLARFQAAEQSLMAHPTPKLEQTAGSLDAELEEMEAATGQPNPAQAATLSGVQANLDADSLLLSFSVTQAGSWLWAVDSRHAAVYPLPPLEQITREVGDFEQALQTGTDSTAAGRRLSSSLFSGVPQTLLNHSRWLLEPDGPLYELPFAALPVGDSRYLIERAELQIVPGAPTSRRGAIRLGGAFVGIGDPVFNTADARFQGKGVATGIPLPRLPNTGAEVRACAEAWGSPATNLVTGPAASLKRVTEALSTSPAVIHFATHILNAPGQSGSGVIALGLDGNGVLGLMASNDIVAHPVPGALVVVNGCYSGQGKALPGSGLMGLTRAWMGAGADAVIATRWDVPDDTAQSLMVSFYGALRGAANGSPARALRAAQLAALRSGGPGNLPARWASYFLLSRI